VLRDDALPGEQQIFGWIEEVFGHGVRRPGYPADRWAEDWLQERFQALGLERVRAEPVPLWYWEPREATLTVTSGEQSFDVSCFPLPHSASTSGFEAEVLPLDRGQQVGGSATLHDLRLNRVPSAVFKNLATWSYDPDDTFSTSTHTLPFGREMMDVTGSAVGAGASAFVGSLAGYPGNSCRYYVPYDAVERPIPAVWISGSDGERIRGLLDAGTVRVRITVDAVREQITSYNIVGELPGADDESVIIGSHHDGPWSSAVEDASGIALVLAQASYWSRVPQAERPHRLVFLLNAGHMSGGAGQASFVESHRAELDSAVLELHLEHAAAEFAENDGVLAPTGQPETRWWFTSKLRRLQAALREAIEAEDMRRSLILPPTVFGEKPTTDGADFYPAGVPIVHYLAAPFYLFDEMDTLDKIHRPSLSGITRSAIRIVESTAGVSAAAMRSDPMD
jgi:hypothetical protein